ELWTKGATRQESCPPGKTAERSVSAVMERLRGNLGGRVSEALARSLRLKIAGVVRGDNWSEGRLKGRWPILKRGLPNHPRDWAWTSWARYFGGEKPLLGMDV